MEERKLTRVASGFGEFSETEAVHICHEAGFTIDPDEDNDLSPEEIASGYQQAAEQHDLEFGVVFQVYKFGLICEHALNGTCPLLNYHDCPLKYKMSKASWLDVIRENQQISLKQAEFVIVRAVYQVIKERAIPPGLEPIDDAAQKIFQFVLNTFQTLNQFKSDWGRDPMDVPELLKELEAYQRNQMLEEITDGAALIFAGRTISVIVEGIKKP